MQVGKVKVRESGGKPKIWVEGWFILSIVRNKKGVADAMISLSGISGAVPTPPKSTGTPSQSHSQSNTLASSSISLDIPTSPILQNVTTLEDNLPMWDCGFVIYHDETATLPSNLGVCQLTPKSQKISNAITNTYNRDMTHTTSIGSTSTSHSTSIQNNLIPELNIPYPPSPTPSNPLEDQENIPPPLIRSTTSTPKSNNSTPSHHDESNWLSPSRTRVGVLVSGSGRRRGTGEKSKLVESSLFGEGDDVVIRGGKGDREEEGGGEGEELTPGRTDILRSKGKARLTREINVVR